MATNNAINNTLQSPFNVGATSVTATGAQLNYLAGLTSAPINKVAIQVITGTGTFTPTSGAVFYLVEGVGGGGGGAGVPDPAASNARLAGGGGGAGYFRKLLTAQEMGANAAVTIGAAGPGGAAGANNGTAGTDTVFNPAGTGATLTASGGGAGTFDGADRSVLGLYGGPGSGGGATNGDLNIAGAYGRPGLLLNVANASGAVNGEGGNSFWGMGGRINTDGTGDGRDGSGYGAGGSGATSVNAAGTNAGGSGTIGLVIVTEFISA